MRVNGHDPKQQKLMKELQDPVLQAILQHDRYGNRKSARAAGRKSAEEARREDAQRLVGMAHRRDLWISKWFDDNLKKVLWGWLFEAGKKRLWLPRLLGVRWDCYHGSEDVQGIRCQYSILRISVWGIEKAVDKVFWKEK